MRICDVHHFLGGQLYGKVGRTHDLSLTSFSPLRIHGRYDHQRISFIVWNRYFLRLCRLVCSVYDREDPQARRIAANIAKVPELLKRPTA